MAIESKNLLVAVKAFSPANPLPLDARSLWDTKAEAENYAKQANAYGGQIITAKVDGKFKPFILQGENIQTQLNGKAPSGHSHSASQITGLPTIEAITDSEIDSLRYL